MFVGVSQSKENYRAWSMAALSPRNSASAATPLGMAAGTMKDFIVVSQVFRIWVTGRFRIRTQLFQ
jgi:hypothetical protein